MITLLLRTRLVIAGVLLAGCSNTIPIISTSIECPVKEEDLAAKCAEPATIATGATYQDLIRIAIADRKNLSECEKNRQFLQNSINEYRLQLGGQTYCFRDLFEIRWRSFVCALCGPVVQAGDSGAWVCAETDRGPGWCGQIIGEDRHVGYATFAENTIAAWSKAGKNLRVE
jgi:hypothetical protein